MEEYEDQPHITFSEDRADEKSKIATDRIRLYPC